MSTSPNDAFFLSSDILCHIGIDGTIIGVNQAFELRMGRGNGFMRGQSFSAFIPEADINLVGNLLERLKRDKVPVSGNIRFKFPNDKVRCFLWLFSLDMSGKSIWALALDVNCSQNQDKKFLLAVEASPNPMIIVDESEKISYMNREAERVFDYHRDDIIGSHIEILIPNRFRHNHSELHHNFLTENKHRPMGLGKAISGLRRDGREMPMEVGLQPIHTNEGLLTICGINDLTEIKKAEEKILIQKSRLEEVNKRLEEMATTDSLTKLKNRRIFFEQMSLLLNMSHRQKKNVSMIMADVDNFKQYNDTYGHQAGDLALSQVGTIMLEVCRSSDVVARYGGEEFAILLPDTDREGSINQCHNLAGALAVNNWEHREITVSFGAATMDFHSRDIPIGEETIKSFITFADEALYRAKELGKNGVVHAWDM